MAARAVDRNDPLKLWVQVHGDLWRRICEKEFEGSFPTEATLCRQYGVSRGTVGRAVRALRADGVVIVERGRPPEATFPPASPVSPAGAVGLCSSVEAGGLWQRSIVRALSVRTDCEIAARLDTAASTSLIYLERLRVRDEIPLALDQVWLPAELAQPLLRADFTYASLYDELASRARVPLTAAWDQIETVILSSAERAILGCSSQVGAFRIVREGFSGVRRVEWRQTLVRGDRLRLRSELSTPSTQR